MIGDENQNPLLTIGVVVLNREWIIRKMLGFLLKQTYPHDRIFVVIVDGKSEDKTVEVAQRILEKSDFRGYEIIVKECTIPEGRNICIENMRGDMLLFWDSDIVMEPNAVRELVRTMVQEKADIVTADAVFIYANTVEEIDTKINDATNKRISVTENCVIEVPFAGMGHTLISSMVLNSLRFDTDLTISEDKDFTVRAREKGYKILSDRRILAFDINMRKKEHSDIHVDMPLQKALRGLRKKAKAHVLASAFKITPKAALKFFLENRRYIFYLCYIPMALSSAHGVFLGRIYLALVFPIYLMLFIIWQVKRRGLMRGLKAVLRSILVGLPFSLMLVHYFCKYMMTKQKGNPPLN